MSTGVPPTVLATCPHGSSVYERLDQYGVRLPSRLERVIVPCSVGAGTSTLEDMTKQTSSTPCDRCPLTAPVRPTRRRTSRYSTHKTTGRNPQIEQEQLAYSEWLLAKLSA